MVSSLIYALMVLAVSVQGDCSVLYFQSAQCEPCRQFEPVLSQLQQQGWDVHKIEAPTQLELAKRFQIKNLPTVVVMNGEREVDRIVGVVSLDQLQSRLSRAAARNRSAIANQVPAQPATHTSAGQTQNGQAQGGSALATMRAIPSSNQPMARQPIVRGQSPDAGAPNFAAPGQAFPMLAANSSTGRSRGSTNAAEADFNDPDSATSRPAFQPSMQPAVQPASTSRSTPGRGATHATLNSDRVPSEISIAEAMARATDATVRIKVEESNTIAHGTGTIVAVHGDEALVLTCGHLFRDMLPGSQLSLDLFAGTPRQVNLVAQLIDFKADQEDIALLSVRLPVKLEPVPILPRSEVVQKGQSVFTIGCDHGNNPTRHDTKISNVNRYLGAANIEIVGAPAVGRSGGGLFDAQGRLLGVCNAACKDDNEGIYAGLDVIYQQLTRIGHAHLFEVTDRATTKAASTDVKSSLSSIRTPAGSSPALANSVPPNGSAQWPDDDPRLDVVSSEHSARDSGLDSKAVAASSNSSELICIVRDAAGKERVLTISQPTTELLQAIEQQGVVTR